MSIKHRKKVGTPERPSNWLNYREIQRACDRWGSRNNVPTKVTKTYVDAAPIPARTPVTTNIRPL